MTDVIRIEGLHKEYRRLRAASTVALNGLDLSVPPGGVFGFLGPNGSGKTTTIRCLLGLVRPSRGSCRILDKDPQTHLADVIDRIGSIVETPAFFGRFSARRNLQLLAGLSGTPMARVEEVLAEVGLLGRAKDKVKNYSLGMRQRLGIAAALLKSPELLVLDEPANGLDPAGIKEVRELLKRLAVEGRTVFVSSHILSEVAQTCDYVAILSRGRSVAAGPVSEVLATGGARGLLVRIDDPDRAIATLRAAGMESSREGEIVRVDVPVEEASRVTKALAHAGLYLSELKHDEADLETVFLQLTQETSSEEPTR